MRLTPGTRVGHYQITAPIGAGGMGEVYRAHDPRLDREVALKILAREHASSDDRRLRFEQEAKSASALSHPNIITIHEVGDFADSESRAHYIAMELIYGKSLRELLADGPLPLRKLLPIAAQIADGLAAAHGKGIAHRDLKPENIMVTADGFVKILDFGLAKLLSASTDEDAATVAKPAAKTTPGTVMGTAAYMSPEQAAARAADFRSDQFSFGSILYEMITGRRAFQRETSAQTMSAIIESDPPPLHELAPKTPPPLRWIVERCLAKDPDERYASTRDLARDLHTLRDRVAEASSSGALMAEVSASPAARRFGARPVIIATAVLVALGIAAGYLAGRGSSPKTNEPPAFKRITFRGRVASAAFTPDGASVLYTARVGARSHQLFLARIGTPEPQLLGESPGAVEDISRNGEVAVLKNGVLSRMPLGGGAPRGIAQGVRSASWSPDGTNLAIVRATATGEQIEFPIGTVLAKGVMISSPHVSPDGAQIAYFEFDSGRWSVAVIDLATKKSRRLAGTWESVTRIAWEPSGTNVVASVNGGTHQELIRVSMRGNVEPIAPIGREMVLHDIASDGRLLVAQVNRTARMFRRSLTKNEEQELSWLDSSTVADVSADGSMILFFEAGDGGSDQAATYLYRAGEQIPIRLGEGLAEDLSDDGQWALSTTLTSPERLLLLPTGVGEPRQLSTGALVNLDGCAFLPGARRLLVSGNEAGAPRRIYILDTATNKLQSVGPEGLLLPAAGFVSADGTQALAAGDDPKPVLINTIDGKSQRVDVVDPIGWSATGNLYSIRAASPTADIIEEVNINTLAKKNIGTFAVPGADMGAVIDRIVITPDGAQAVYSVRQQTADLFELTLQRK